VHVVAAPNSLGVGWMLPTLVLLTLAEVLICVTGLEFCYMEANEFFFINSLKILNFLLLINLFNTFFIA
jgi:hypothetical protein